MRDFISKLQKLPLSRRFWMAVIGVITISLQETLGLTEEQATVISGILMAWIVGDSIQKT